MSSAINQIAKYIKAFISGMMGKPADEPLKWPAPGVLIKLAALEEMERIQPKRRARLAISPLSPGMLCYAKDHPIISKPKRKGKGKK